jgi:hypothetical protein
MVCSLALGLVLFSGATAALPGRLPPGEVPTTVAAQAPPELRVNVQPPAAAPSVVPPPKKTPFENLFQNLPRTPSHSDAAAALAEQLAARTKVVCGLTMMLVDPNMDPKIRVGVSAAPAQPPHVIVQPDFKIRRITPTVCRE